MMWLILVALALTVLVFYKPTEHMTSKDLIATLDKFGKAGTPPKKDPYEEKIYGPKAPKLEEPSPMQSKKGGDDGNNTYPDIYGPEVTPIPGQKQSAKTGKHTSDSVTDDTYGFNPDLERAFPREENGPQPFLADYSKFQH